MTQYSHVPDAGLTEAAQHYMLTARSIVGAGQHLTVTALAARMGVSKQAASEMAARLAAEGMLTSEGELVLTPAGQAAADAIFTRHALLEWLLTEVIGLDWAASDEEAMRLQAAVSPRVEAAIRALVGDPSTCPHGNPVDLETARSRPAGVPLAKVQAGTQVTIYRITEEAEEDPELLRYFQAEGLMPGTVVTVADVSSSRDAVTLEGPGGRSTMGLRPAGLIRVLPGKADPSLFHRIPPRTLG